MKTNTMEIPVLQKSTILQGKKAEIAASCCAPKKEATVCCTPSKTKEENEGACCAQPEDGSSCCNK